MFNVGDRVRGFTYTRGGERVQVEGEYVTTTDDPEEYFQDIVIKTDDGRIVYIDEQEAYPAELFPSDFIEGTSLDPAVQAAEDATAIIGEGY